MRSANASFFLLLSAFFLVTVGPPAGSAEPLGVPDRYDIEYPDDEPPSDDEVLLGKTLFFDTRLSLKRTQSCNTCHNIDLGWGDAMQFSLGDRGNFTGRNTPHIYNLAWNHVFFWDGRAASLEEQALGPIQAGGEMDMPLDLMLRRLKVVPWYRDMFKKVYGDNAMVEENVARALAAFERTIIVDDTPFDKYIQGDKSAMSPAAIRGMALYEGKAQCIKCHDGPNFTDESFHNIGLEGEDMGRYRIAEATGMQKAFKTPGLRNVLFTAPYMHDGSLGTIQEVVEFYNRGGDVENKAIEKLDLTEEEKRDLIAFLGALNQRLDIEKPVIPPDPEGLRVD